MSLENNHSDFTNFRKYYTGDMSASEKTIFEENLENDPFVKDAYEGFLLYDTDFAKISSIEKTNMAFKEKIGLEATSAFSLKPIFAIAASVLVLFSAFYVLQNNFFNNRNGATVAKNETKIIEVEQQNTEIEIQEELISDTAAQNFDDQSVFIDKDIVIENVIIDEVKEEVKIEVENKIIKTADEKFKDLEKPRANRAEKKQISAEDFYKNNSAASNGGFYEEEREDVTVGNNVPSVQESAAQFNSLYYNEDVEKDKSFSPDINSFKSGIVAYNQSNYSKAIQNFEESLKQNQNVNSANYYVGMSYFNLNKHNKAITAFDKVINSSSSFADDSMWYKSLSLINKGQKSKAKTILESLVNTNSNFKNAAQKKLQELNL